MHFKWVVVHLSTDQFIVIIKQGNVNEKKSTYNMTKGFWSEVNIVVDSSFTSTAQMQMEDKACDVLFLI